MKNLNTIRTKRKANNVPDRSTLITDCFNKEVYCFLQIDGYDRSWEDDCTPVDKNGHGAFWGINHDLRRHNFPVRVQILEGTKKETVLALLNIAIECVKKDYERAFEPSKFDDTEENLQY